MYCLSKESNIYILFIFKTKMKNFFIFTHAIISKYFSNDYTADGSKKLPSVVFFHCGTDFVCLIEILNVIFICVLN